MYKSKNTFEQANSLYVVSNRPTYSRAITLEFNLQQIKSFIVGFARVFSFDMTSAALVRTCVDTIILYAVIYYSHQSKFVSHLAHNSKVLTCPSFVVAFLVKIAAEVRSINKETGQSVGTLHCGSNWDNIHAELSKLVVNNDIVSSTLVNTPFERISVDSKLRKQLQTILKERLDHLSEYDSEYTLFDKFYNIYSNIPSLLYGSSTNTSKLNMTQITLREISGQFGIYRFRNGGTDYYFCQQHSLISLTAATKDLYFCFLKLFAPVFSTDNTIINGQLPGDGLYYLSELDPTYAWECYISIKSETSGSKKKKKGNPTSGNGVGDNSTGDNTSEASTVSTSIIDYRLSGDRIQLYSPLPSLLSEGLVYEIILQVRNMKTGKFRTRTVEVYSDGEVIQLGNL